jgi:hypothetical protein
MRSPPRAVERATSPTGAPAAAPSCKQILCSAGDGGVEALKCHDQSECPSGYACILNAGCGETVGQCNNQTMYCPHTPQTFTLCDCDGHSVSIEVNSCAPDRRYAHAGPC